MHFMNIKYFQKANNIFISFLSTIFLHFWQYDISSVLTP